MVKQASSTTNSFFLLASLVHKGFVLSTTMQLYIFIGNKTFTK